MVLTTCSVGSLEEADHVICTEHRVCSDEGDVPFAGTLDGLFKIRRGLVDLKTKVEGKAKPTMKQISNEAMCQLQAYRICLQENYGIHVDRLLLSTPSRQGTVPCCCCGQAAEGA